MPELDPFFFTINTWSFTKHRVWNRCQRQYYYEYIAPYVKSGAIVDPEKIRYFKNFDSKFVVQGQLIHDIIDQQIQLHCENKPMNPAEAMSTYLRKVARYKDMATELLTEYRNGEQFGGSFFEGMEESGKTCLDTFFGMVWPEYANRECLRHEEFDRFRIGDVEVTVKVDFASRLPNGTIVLSDWKTGRDDNEYETELQMAAYVLWAMQYYKLGPDMIKSELVFLKTEETKTYPFFVERLCEIQEMITREFSTMNASYEFPDFPARPSQRECMSCKFAKVCPEAATGRP
ncbi:MAG: PD-(D/E)XK nuclease family protein [Methanoregula sp.]|uniref:RecB family exonuclease n=2 Tax=Methanoregula sp. TaxID=2052170 RepID=UPI003BB08F97